MWVDGEIINVLYTKTCRASYFKFIFWGLDGFGKAPINITLHQQANSINPIQAKQFCNHAKFWSGIQYL